MVIAADSNIRKKEQEKIVNYQRLKEHLEQMWKSKAIPVVIRGLHPGECNLGNNLQPSLRWEIYVNMYLLIVGTLIHLSVSACAFRARSCYQFHLNDIFARAQDPTPLDSLNVQLHLAHRWMSHFSKI